MECIVKQSIILLISVLYCKVHTILVIEHNFNWYFSYEEADHKVYWYLSPLKTISWLYVSWSYICFIIRFGLKVSYACHIPMNQHFHEDLFLCGSYIWFEDHCVTIAQPFTVLYICNAWVILLHTQADSCQNWQLSGQNTLTKPS